MTDLLQAAAEAVELGRAATPGPWGKRKDDWNLEVFPVKKVKKPFQAVAICEIDPDHYPTAKGDAALIAAAPSHVDLIRDLAAEVVRLRADAARLDYLQTEYVKVDPFDMPTGADDSDVGWRLSHYTMQSNSGEKVLHEEFRDDLRAAIDAAMGEKP